MRYEYFLEFIRRNKIIPQLIEGCSRNPENALLLKEAIDAGDSAHFIFDHPHCQIFLLYLFKEKLITRRQCITTMIYLMALMQFTRRQTLKALDDDVKCLNGEVVVYKGRDTEIQRFYADALSKRLRKDEFDISADQIYDSTQQLSTSEQWLISIPYSRNRLIHNDPIINLSRVVIVNTPFFIPYLDAKSYLVPSMSVMEFCLSLMNPSHAINIFPIFGEIGVSTLTKLHCDRPPHHPISFYSPWVKSNPRRVHGERAGPLPQCLHDITHAYMGHLFTQQEYRFIFHCLIPLLTEIKSEHADDPEFIERVEYSIARLTDLNFSSIYGLPKRSQRFQWYMGEHLGIYTLTDFGKPFGSKGDQVFYHVCQKLFERKGEIQSKYGFDMLIILNEVAKAMESELNKRRPSIILEAIIQYINNNKRLDKEHCLQRISLLPDDLLHTLQFLFTQTADESKLSKNLSYSCETMARLSLETGFFHFPPLQELEVETLLQIKQCSQLSLQDRESSHDVISVPATLRRNINQQLFPLTHRVPKRDFSTLRVVGLFYQPLLRRAHRFKPPVLSHASSLLRIGLRAIR